MIEANLVNLGAYVSLTGYSDNVPGFGAGTTTTLAITGPGGNAIVNLEGSGKLDLQDLLQHNALILPPH